MNYSHNIMGDFLLLCSTGIMVGYLSVAIIYCDKKNDKQRKIQRKIHNEFLEHKKYCKIIDNMNNITFDEKQELKIKMIKLYSINCIDIKRLLI